MNRKTRAVCFLIALLCIGTAACTGNKKTVWTSGRAPGTVTEERHTASYEPQAGTAEEFTVAHYFADDMVLPRDREITVWGTAPEDQNGKIVAAEFKGLRGSAVIENGAWKIVLAGTLPASSELGHTLTVSGAGDEKEEFEDVLVGDIWVVGGQSNAELTFFGTVAPSPSDIQELYKEELSQAGEDDNIRILRQTASDLLTNSKLVSLLNEPQNDIQRTYRWRKATEKNVKGTSAATSFSMLGYFFAKEMTRLNPNVPIGMIMTACGGASLSGLASAEANDAFPESMKNQGFSFASVKVPPCGMYNLFMAPITNVSITGMVFLQGETDAPYGSEYGDALKAYIEDLREKVGYNFLFMNLQLTSYGYESGGVTLGGIWDYIHMLRFAQAEVKIDDSISDYEVITSFDHGFQDGDADGAHPYYKKEIAQRAAALAAARLYGTGDAENVGCPVPSKIEYSAKEVRITYDYAGGGLKTLNGQSVRGFEVLENGEWIKALAENVTVDGNVITLSGFNSVAGVRYAPELRYFDTDTANLCSGTGLPAAAFSVEFGGSESK